MMTEQKVGSVKVGIFGGTFNPFHMGHLSCALEITRKWSLQQMILIPTYQSPDRIPTDGPSPQARWEMTNAAIQPYSPLLIASDLEIKRGQLSYTWKTIQELKKLKPDVDEWCLIIGADQFAKFDQWYEFEKILDQVTLIVVNRPGFEWSSQPQHWAIGLKNKLIKNEKSLSQNHALPAHWNIQFEEISQINVSSSEIRRRLRLGESLEGLVPDSVAQMITENNWYHDLHNRIQDFHLFSLQIGKWLNARKAINVVGFELGENHPLADYALVASGTSTRQTTALAEFITSQVQEQLGVWPQNVEGQSEGRWIVIDYGSLIIHLYYDFVRNEYRLEDLWKDKKRLVIEDSMGSK